MYIADLKKGKATVGAMEKELDVEIGKCASGAVKMLILGSLPFIIILFLIGALGTGKSTLFKQMKAKYSGFSPEGCNYPCF